MPKRKIGEVDASLGRNLVFYRKLAGMTQEQVAQQLNINRTTYTKYETGDSEPSIEILRNISEILHVDIGVLLTDDSAQKSVAELGDFEDEDFIALRRRYLALDQKDRQTVLALLKKLGK